MAWVFLAGVVLVFAAVTAFLGFAAAAGALAGRALYRRLTALVRRAHSAWRESAEWDQFERETMPLWTQESTTFLDEGPEC
jgi:hypothetical protein